MATPIDSSLVENRCARALSVRPFASSATRLTRAGGLQGFSRIRRLLYTTSTLRPALHLYPSRAKAELVRERASLFCLKAFGTLCVAAVAAALSSTTSIDTLGHYRNSLEHDQETAGEGRVL